jgi:Terpene cyclase DEP1
MEQAERLVKLPTPMKVKARSPVGWIVPIFHYRGDVENEPMKRKTIYLILCVLGIALPYWQFVPWVVANGLDMKLFVQQLFANRIGGFFGMDVLVSAVTLVVFLRSERPRLTNVERWLPIVAVLSVGVSLGLPLLLYLRERNLERAVQTNTAAV